MRRLKKESGVPQAILNEKYGVRYDAREHTELALIPLRDPSVIQITLYSLIYDALVDAHLDITNGPWLIRYNSNGGENGLRELKRIYREVIWYLSCRLDLEISNMNEDEQKAGLSDPKMTDSRMMNRVKTLVAGKGGFWDYTFYKKLKAADQYYDKSTQHSRETGYDEYGDLMIQFNDKIDKLSNQIDGLRKDIKERDIIITRQGQEIERLNREVYDQKKKNGAPDFASRETMNARPR